MRKASRFGPWPSTTSNGLPTLWLFTDERARLNLSVLPRGAGVVVRHYGHPQRASFVRSIVQQGKALGLIMLVAGDMHLAMAVGAHGVHLPEHLVRRYRKPYAKFIITAAAHNYVALRNARSADAMFLSPLFSTRSHAEGLTLGSLRASCLARGKKQAVFALGGITQQKAKHLATLGFSGIGAIDGWLNLRD
jgi:thiamine-phosphate pyrophosphorylase